MKALVLSVKAGYGHHSTGLAMKECFQRHGIECEMLDTFEYINKFLGEGIQDGYLLTTKYLKDLYGKVYSSLDKKDEPAKKYAPEAMISQYLSNRLKSYMTEYNPDFVIGTHSYAAVLMTLLRQNGVLNCPLFGVVTDFTIHPFWESTNLDYYVLPDMLLTNAATKKGLSKDKLLPFGIPIKEHFSSKSYKQDIRNELGLEDKTTILLMMGSMGFGDMTDTITILDTYNYDFQIVVICGNNEKAKNSIEEIIWRKKIICLGFTNQVDKFMDASDLIITKPGGLTTSEALAKKLPMILMNPIPGQENRNMEFLVNSGVAIGVTETFSLENALFQFFDCEWKPTIMKTAIEHIGKPSSTENLYNFINDILIKNSLQNNIKNLI